ncbi:hypothetical protein [Geitlerinema sp. PCC 9228]|jgi:hypothetical protein|uniref:hypothetical protein n=1 Tax=Geitlerinema sp. PCC 9228 TaxID=111611 RepID=UPI0008F9C169|nr:hypothetical protein [Geitlerinema sp. PCC 9228]
MKSWEFFIQQEGDRTWLPLESPEVEILEGRYRLVARCDRANTPVEVRVSYQPEIPEEGEPRVWKREKTTNQEGLMVVLPFTYFQPGIWELSCLGDLMESESNPSWQHAIKLQSLPKDRCDTPTSPAAWETATQEESPPSEEPEPPEAIASPTSPAASPPEDTAATQPEPASQPQNENTSPLTATVTDRRFVQSWHLLLDRETYILEQENTLTLSGRIEATGVSAVELPDGILQVRLYDPQTSQVLFDRQYPTPETIPSSFGYALEISGENKRRLMLGEARLYDAYGKQLAMGTFSIMAQLQAWLDSLHQETPPAESPSQNPPAEPSYTATADINLSFLDLVGKKEDSQNQSETSDRSQTQPSKTTSILPPQLQPDRCASPENPASPSPRPGKSPELPTFGNSLHQPSPPSSPASESPQPQPEVTQDSSETPPETSATPAPLPVEAENSVSEPEVTLSSDAAAFPDLQNRFWSRLNAIARDGDLAEWLKWHLPPLAESSSSQAESNQTSEVTRTDSTNSDATSNRLTDSHRSDRDSNEIVVMDDEDNVEGNVVYSYAGSSHFLSIPKTPSHPQQAQTSAPSPEADTPEAFLAQRNFAPQFSLPEEDFVAGRQTWVTVKIPILDAKVYVKLWLQDCESRTLLDGPYWLTEFTPDGWGYELASTEITIPYGSLQIQLEAIAVDIYTHQESYKASVRRLVVPPGPPTLPQT